MENINNDIIKLTTLLESTQNDGDSNESSDEESGQNFEFVSVSKNTDSSYESITNDEETIFILETCSDPLLKNALICNIKKKNMLNELIKTLEENLKKIKNIQRENVIRSLFGTKFNKKTIIRKRLGIPYFKDSSFFPSPQNDDYILMQTNKHFSVLDCVKKENWSTFHKCELVKAVYKTICSNRSAQIKTEIRNLETKLKDLGDTFANVVQLQRNQILLNNVDLIESIAKQWQCIKIKPDRCVFIKNKLIEKTDDSYFILMLIYNWELTSADWQNISDNHFELKFTPRECQSMWNCYLHPKYSKDPWKEVENIKLQELVEKWKHENWDAIADELNIQKSAYQCCVHFYSKLYDKFLRTKWTVEEEQLLNELVAASRIGNHINWTKIAHYFKGRTKSQIYSHYYQVMLPSLTKGAFSIEEDVLLLTLLKLHNNDMRKVKLYFSTRSLSQLRDRFKTMSRDDSQEWTLKDDCRIIEHVEQHGPRKWYFLDDMNRSNACIRHRYYTLERWFEQNPNDDLQDVQRRYKTNYKRNIQQRFNLLNTAVLELLKIVKHHPSDDKKILNLTYIRTNVLKTIPIYKSLKKNKKNSSYYKTKCLVRKQKLSDSEGTLYNYCTKFFQPAFKKFSRGKVYVTSEDFAAKAKRVMNILELLGAKLILPTNEDEIEENIILTSSDKGVLHEIIKLRTSDQNEKNQLQLQYLIPPTPETLIGLRGLMLHSSTLRSHSRGNYEGYRFYVRLEQRFEKKGINYIKRLNDINISNLENEEKQMVIQERSLFWKRLKILFSWPCIMQDTKIEPNICEAPPPPEEITESPALVVKKKGRPIKNKNLRKINLMNKARFDKKKQVSNETNLNLPSTSKTGYNGSNTGNNYKLTKHEDNTFIIQYKSIPESASSAISIIEENKLLNKTLVKKSDRDSDDDDDDDELDEDVQKLLMESKNINTKEKPDNVVINQMSKAIKNILVKNNDPGKTNETNTILNTESNKRKAKIIVIPSKKVKK